MPSSPEPSGDAAAQALVDRFAAAFENADLAALAEILREDVALEMPPMPAWFAGREAVLRFYATAPLAAGPGAFRMVPVDANGEQGFGVYRRQPDGAFAFHAIAILTVTPTGISRIVTFIDSRLAGPFGLPAEMGDLLGTPGPPEARFARLRLELLVDRGTSS